MKMPEKYHESTQEWSYYKFDSIGEAVRFLHEMIKSDEFSPSCIYDFKFFEYEDEIGVGIMDSYENH